MNGDGSTPATWPLRDGGSAGESWAEPDGSPAGELPPGAPGTATAWLSASWVPYVIGVLATVLGLLPWLLVGARLPIQNLWATETPPELAPIVALPFSQYLTTPLVAYVVLAWVSGGLTVRLLGFRLGARAPLIAGVTIAVLQVIALVQTAIVVGTGLQETDQAQVYLWGLTGGTAAAIGIGALLYRLISIGAVPGAAVALSIGAIVAGGWLNTMVWAVWGMDRYPPVWLIPVTEWIPPVLVGLVVAWCGIGTVGRKAAAVASLLLLWVLPALLGAISATLGTRVLANDPTGMLDYFVNTFRQGLGPWGPGREWMLQAAIVALIASAALWLVRRAKTSRDDQPSPAPG